MAQRAGDCQWVRQRNAWPEAGRRYVTVVPQSKSPHGIRAWVSATLKNSICPYIIADSPGCGPRPCANSEGLPKSKGAKYTLVSANGSKPQGAFMPGQVPPPRLARWPPPEGIPLSAAAVNDAVVEEKGHSSHHQKVIAKAGSAHGAENKTRGLNRKLGKEAQAD